MTAHQRDRHSVVRKIHRLVEEGALNALDAGKLIASIDRARANPDVVSRIGFKLQGIERRSASRMQPKSMSSLTGAPRIPNDGEKLNRILASAFGLPPEFSEQVVGDIFEQFPLWVATAGSEAALRIAKKRLRSARLYYWLDCLKRAAEIVSKFRKA